MRLFMAALLTETNTFSPIPAGLGSFTSWEYHRDDGSRKPPQFANIPLIPWRALAEAAGYEVIESLSTFSTPSGPVLTSAYETLRDTILEDLRRQGPFNVVLLFLHGSMVAHGYEDCEGDILARARDIVGRTVTVGVEIDPHCSLTEAMCANADVIVVFKEYPHTDIAERAHDLFSLCDKAARKAVRPVMAWHDCRMISVWRTSSEPTRSFVARMKALEGHDGVLSVSFAHGFPWGDVPDLGARTLVVTDNDLPRAEALSAELAREIWDMRDQTFARHDTIDEGIDAALAAPRGPVVLADVADNAGGGAPGDNTAVLRRLIERRVTGVAIGCFWDPVAVQFCREAGVGARFELRIGGKCGRASGDPIDLMVTVRNVLDSHSQEGLSDGRFDCGASAWVEADGVDVVLISQRGQTHAPDAFTGLGCTLADKRIVVVKSSQHFYAGFAPIAAEIRYVSAPGALTMDFANIPYVRKIAPFWPRVADPFAA